MTKREFLRERQRALRDARAAAEQCVSALTEARAHCAPFSRDDSALAGIQYEVQQAQAQIQAFIQRVTP